MADYPAIMDDEQEDQPKNGYAPVPPPRPIVPPPVNTMPVPAPAIPTAPPVTDPNAISKLTSPAPAVEPPARPQWKDYAPPERHGMAKLGSILAASSPWLNRAVNVAPEQRAEKNYKGATSDYDTELAQGEKERAEQRSEANTQSEEQLRQEQAKQFGLVPVKVPWQDAPVMVQQKDAARLEQEIGRGKSAADIATGKNETTKEVATGKNKTAEDITKERTASAERIATGRNLANKEIATIRASMANDPNKLTNTMKTMKQQAQATLPQIDKALDETEKVAGLLGPTEGRWNDFWQGKVGVSDPAYAHYKDEIGMVSTAVTLAHARGRMSNELFEHFQQMFDAGKQSPENMIQALNVAHEWLDGYAKMGDEAQPQTQSQTQTHGGYEYTKQKDGSWKRGKKVQ